MRLQKGPWDGAQPRTHVLKVLRSHGVAVQQRTELGDFYELVDLDGDPVVIHIPNPVLSETIAYLYRRFGHLHGFSITDLVAPRRRH